MDKKLLLFSYYLQKLAQKEQELLRSDDFRLGLFALICANTRLFRRFAHGCTVEPICFCDPMYAQELFIYLCLDAKAHGDSLLNEFDFHQTTGFPSRSVKDGMPYVQDMALTFFLIDKVYPPVLTDANIDIALFKKLGDIICEPDLPSKIRHHDNVRDVHPEALHAFVPCKETEMIDRALARLTDDSVMQNMLSSGNKCNLNAESVAYAVVKQHISSFPKE